MATVITQRGICRVELLEVKVSSNGLEASVPPRFLSVSSAALDELVELDDAVVELVD